MSGGLFGSLGISASGMSADRLRMDVVAENLANADTTRGANGQPYQRKEVILQEVAAARTSPTRSPALRRRAPRRRGAASR